ncbi:MAG: penicillin acylase family protein, partial [Planctomycetota bacterium]
MFATLATLGGCALLASPKPGTVTLDERLAVFPTADLPLAGPATVRWNDRAVPFIVAADESDVPFLIGLVHGHLRRAQMEIFLRIARGELASMAGAPAKPVDELLRAVDIDRAVPAIEAALPDATREWLQRYADGVNFQAEHHPKRPWDMRLLALSKRREWTVADSLTIARLASIDATLGPTLQLLAARGEPGFDAFLRERRAIEAEGVPSFGPGEATPLGELAHIASSGSNSLVVAPSRSATGAALMANDPHLGFFVPSLWVLIGYRSPGGAAVGLTVPGVPAVALGRNDHIAFGGTRMMAHSSALYDVSDLPDEAYTERREHIAVRWWFDATRRIRESTLGPVITDGRLAQKFGLPPLALRWRGHDASDEFTALLRASRARDWAEFRAAWEGYAVGGLNMVYADEEGHIGQLMAFEQVPAAAEAARVLAADPADRRTEWGPGTPSTELPAAYDPAQGYLLSANNVPFRTEPPITGSGNQNDRILRMAELVTRTERVGLPELAALQQDVYLRSAHDAARAMTAAAGRTVAPAFHDVVTAWDGRFDRGSRGAHAYQAWVFEVYERAYVPRIGRTLSDLWRGSQAAHTRIARDLEDGTLSSAALEDALAAAADDHDLTVAWGDQHTIPLQHPLGAAPVIGSGWRFGEIPGDGTLGTVRKTAAPFTTGKRRAFFGSHVRHLSDLGDPDENYFVFLGGQDGWTGSSNMIDQVELWED